MTYIGHCVLENFAEEEYLLGVVFTSIFYNIFCVASGAKISAVVVVDLRSFCPDT